MSLYSLHKPQHQHYSIAISVIVLSISIYSCQNNTQQERQLVQLTLDKTQSQLSVDRGPEISFSKIYLELLRESSDISQHNIQQLIDLHNYYLDQYNENLDLYKSSKNYRRLFKEKIKEATITLIGEQAYQAKKAVDSSFISKYGLKKSKRSILLFY